MRENTRELVIHHGLLNPVVDVKAGLCSPADMDCGEDVFLGVLHEGRKVRPVIDLLERKLLHRCSCDDKTVKLLVSDLVKRDVELFQVRKILHLAVVSLHHDELQVHLKRRVGQHAHELNLSGLKRRHEIEDPYLQRTDFLLTATGVGHDKDALSPEFV